LFSRSNFNPVQLFEKVLLLLFSFFANSKTFEYYREIFGEIDSPRSRRRFILLCRKADFYGKFFRSGDNTDLQKLISQTFLIMAKTPFR